MTNRRWPHAALFAAIAALSTGCASVPLLTDSADEVAMTGSVPGTAFIAAVATGQPTGVDCGTDLEAATPPAGGGDDVDAPKWRTTISLYAWVPSYRGDQRVKGVDSDPNLSRSDVLDNTEIALSGRAEFQPPDSDFSFWGDIFWASLEDDADTETAVGSVDADGTVRLTFVEAAAALHVWQSKEEWTASARKTARTKFDLYGGARYTRMRTKLSVNAKDIGAKASVDEAEDWIDPIIGARIRHGLTPRLWLIGRGDIGGFDIGTSSHRTWTLTGTLQYVIDTQWAIGGGWRAMDIDYKRNDFKADVRMSGPFMTLTYDF